MVDDCTGNLKLGSGLARKVSEEKMRKVLPIDLLYNTQKRCSVQRLKDKWEKKQEMMYKLNTKNKSVQKQFVQCIRLNYFTNDLLNLIILAHKDIINKLIYMYINL